MAGVLFATGLDTARSLYQATRYEEAIRAVGEAGARDAAVLELLGLCYYRLEEYKKSSGFFERAVSLNPRDSRLVHWLGRAYGRRAETSSPFTAPSLASKARQQFEKAVELDGRNIEAMSDLFTYYLEAPGFLGGGVDKAEALAARIAALDVAEGHFAQAKLAGKRRDWARAEAEYRRAIEKQPKSLGRLLDLAQFLSHRSRHQESDAVFAQAEKLEPGSPKLLYARASAYIEAKRNIREARQLLERYLAAALTPEDPSRKEARRLLEKTKGG